MLLDYELMKLIWWGLIGILLIGFALTDGFDLGTAIVLPLIGKTDNDRRLMLNALAPHWDGNQVWLITAGGAIFAAWPQVYATAFSGFYWAMMLVLFTLICRPLALEYRAKLLPAQQRWCDRALFLSGLVPALVFGVAFGNLFLGFGFRFDPLLRSSFSDGLLDLFHPFALLAGLVSVLMLIQHGCCWLSLKTEPQLAARAAALARLAAAALILAFAAAGLYLSMLPGYSLIEIGDPATLLNPLQKTVMATAAGSWLDNYVRYPWIILAPLAGFSGALAVVLLNPLPRPGWSFCASALSLGGIIMTAGLSLFPFILPSSLQLEASLTVWDATSSPLTLSIMTAVAALLVPVVLGYSAWCFYRMRGRVHQADLAQAGRNLY